MATVATTSTFYNKSYMWTLKLQLSKQRICIYNNIIYTLSNAGAAYYLSQQMLHGAPIYRKLNTQCIINVHLLWIWESFLVYAELSLA